MAIGRVFELLICLFSTATLVEGSLRFNYCSLAHTSMVIVEAEKYFMEVFTGYGVPLSDQCPFKDIKKLDEMYLVKGFDKRRSLAS